MKLIDLSKRLRDDDGNFIQFSCPSIENLLGPDPYRQVSGFLVPSRDDDHQNLIVSDCRDYHVKVYSRSRKDKDSPWKEWEFLGHID